MTAVVFGGAGRLGAVIARELTANGAHVVTVSRRGEVAADVSDPVSRQELLDTLPTMLGAGRRGTRRADSGGEHHRGTRTDPVSDALRARKTPAALSLRGGRRPRVRVAAPHAARHAGGRDMAAVAVGLFPPDRVAVPAGSSTHGRVLQHPIRARVTSEGSHRPSDVPCWGMPRGRLPGRVSRGGRAGSGPVQLGEVHRWAPITCRAAVLLVLPASPHPEACAGSGGSSPRSAPAGIAPNATLTCYSRDTVRRDRMNSNNRCVIGPAQQRASRR